MVVRWQERRRRGRGSDSDVQARVCPRETTAANRFWAVGCFGATWARKKKGEGEERRLRPARNFQEFPNLNNWQREKERKRKEKREKKGEEGFCLNKK